MADTDNPIEQELNQRLEALARVLDSPAAIAKALGKWVEEKYPDRVGHGMWITVDGDRDKGLTVRLLTLPAKTDLTGLLGKETAGLALTRALWANPDGSASLTIGLGLVTPYDNIGGEWSPVAVASFRF